ncbi:MAG: hypothetical protein ABSG40_19355, partial [Terriglobales bacterium]
SWLHSVVIGLSPFVGLTTTRYSCYATKRQPFYFFVEKLGLVELQDGSRRDYPANADPFYPA